MKEPGEKGLEFSIDHIESLSLRNNWCSRCVNVFISEANGEWNSCGTGLLTFSGKRRHSQKIEKFDNVKHIKGDEDEWDPSMFTLQVRARKNLANNNKSVQIDPEIKKKLSMNGSPDLILQCELKKAKNCSQKELYITWFQEDIGEHLAMSFLSAVAIVSSW